MNLSPTANDFNQVFLLTSKNLVRKIGCPPAMLKEDGGWFECRLEPVVFIGGSRFVAKVALQNLIQNFRPKEPVIIYGSRPHSAFTWPFGSKIEMAPYFCALFERHIWQSTHLCTGKIGKTLRTTEATANEYRSSEHPHAPC